MSDLVPIVVGGVLAFGGGAVTEWLRDRRAARGTREDRKEVRQEHRDDLERETMIELQDAVQKYIRAVGAVSHLDEMASRRGEEMGPVPQELNDTFYASQVMTTKLSTRIRDDDVRGWVKELMSHGAALALPTSGLDRSEHRDEMVRLVPLVQERLGEHIRSL